MKLVFAQVSSEIQHFLLKLEELNKSDIPDGSVLVIIDVASLYTNIDHEDEVRMRVMTSWKPGRIKSPLRSCYSTKILLILECTDLNLATSSTRSNPSFLNEPPCEMSCMAISPRLPIRSFIVPHQNILTDTIRRPWTRWSRYIAFVEFRSIEGKLPFQKMYEI